MTLPKYLYCVTFFFSLAAFTCAFIGTSCHFVQFTSLEPIEDPRTNETQRLTLQFGYWAYNSYNVTGTAVSIQGGSCDYYPSSITVDKNWSAARTFNLIAIIIGGSIILLDIFQGCLSTQRERSCRLGVFGYSVCCLSSGLSLLLMDSNICTNNALVSKLESGMGGISFPTNCSLSTGGKSTVAATVLWGMAAAGSFFLHNYYPRKASEREQLEDEGLDEPLFQDA